MAEHRAEVDAIAGHPWPPTFEDTIAALERAGQRLRRDVPREPPRGDFG
jgi:peptidyl-dipeptidase Dcp